MILCFFIVSNGIINMTAAQPLHLGGVPQVQVNANSPAKQGNFMERPVKWILEPNHTLRKVLAVIAAVLLSLSVIGLGVVIPGVLEWQRQTSVTDLKTGKTSQTTPSSPPAIPKPPKKPKPLVKIDEHQVRQELSDKNIWKGMLNVKKDTGRTAAWRLDNDQTLFDGYIKHASDLIIAALQGDENLVDQHFDTLFKFLQNTKVFTEPKAGDKIAFWSHMHGNVSDNGDLPLYPKGLPQAHYKTDESYEIYVLLFTVGILAKSPKLDDKVKNSAQFMIWSKACSKLAEQVKGESHFVIMDEAPPDDLSTQKPFLAVGNYYWSFELPTLINRHQTGEIADILFRYVVADEETDMWGHHLYTLQDVHIDDDALDAVELRPRNGQKLIIDESVQGKEQLDALIAQKEQTKQPLTIGDVRKINEQWHTVFASSWT